MRRLTLSYMIVFAALAALSLGALGCNGDDSRAADAKPGEDAPEAILDGNTGLEGLKDDAGRNEPDPGILGKLGTLHITAHYQGEVSGEAKVVAVLMDCPFKMPPKASGEFPAPSFPAEGDLPYIEPGLYCLLAFIDMAEGDGIHPLPGVDAELVLPDEDVTVEVTMEAGKTTTVELDFAIKEESREGEPGPDDVWIHLLAVCDGCAPTGKFVMYGNPGPSAEGMPSLYFSEPEPEFALNLVVKESFMMGIVQPFPEGEVTLIGYHDVDGFGMKHEEGEPIAAPVTVVLKKGQLNEVSMTLK